MNPETLMRVYSEEFADFMIDWVGDQAILQAYEAYNIINILNAVAYVPVREVTNTIILERGYGIMPTLYGHTSEASIEASGINRIRSIPTFNLRGQGVLIGIIDSGIDYTNPIFRYADNTTKIASIWDQSIFVEEVPDGVPYGSIFYRDQINVALQSENPLAIVPSVDEVGHGTMVAGIAVGNEVPASDFYGVAPDAELVVVKLKQAKQYLRNFFQIPTEVACYQENDVLFGISFLLEESIRLNRPLVICIAIGSNFSAHDGRGRLPSILSLIASAPGVAIIVGAGNEGNARRHYYGTVNPLVGYNTVELNVGANEPGFTMELWGESPSTFSIDITTPTGEYVPRIAASLDDHREISFVFEPTTIFIDYQAVEADTGDQLILFRFINPTAGIWRFNVYERGDIRLGFHIWLPLGSFISPNTYFIVSDPYVTIVSPGNAEIPITTTAYNPADESLYFNASRGYNRLGYIKPEIAAPGINIVGPTLAQGFTTFTGTSVAAAHTAGIAAMVLEWGNVRGNLVGLGTIELRKLMMRGARRAPGMVYPNRDWGYGILDVFNIFDSLRVGVV